jgi:CRP/FNR family transcriptional regulator, cyclic AMP receptor protein
MGRGARATLHSELLDGACRALPLAGLSRAGLTDVLAGSRLLGMPRGQTVLRANGDAVLVVISGAAIARSVTPEGDTVVLSILSAGSSAGTAAVVCGHTAATEVEALTDVRALAIPGGLVRRVVKECPEFAVACLRAVAAELVAANEETAIFASSSATERVIERLVQLTERFGEQGCDSNRIRISVPLSQSDLASWARTSRESTARVLHLLRREAIVDTHRRELTILDLPGLHARRSATRPDPEINRMLQGWT